MRTRAAVALEAGKPLEIMDVNLDGPRAGEVLVEIKATGICHTDEFTLSGADPEGLFPAILGHEGAGVVVEVGRGRDFAEAGRSRDPALHARMPGMRILPQPEDQPLPVDPQHPGAGPDAGRDLAVLDARWRADPALHGLLDLSNHTVLPEIALAKIPGRAVRQGLLHRLRRDHGNRRGDQHRQGGDRFARHRLWPRRHRPERDPGAAAGRRRPDRGRRLNPAKKPMADASA
jgi:hypothetical protein